MADENAGHDRLIAQSRQAGQASRAGSRYWKSMMAMSVMIVSVTAQAALTPGPN